MDSTKEFLFLTELRFLTDSAVFDAERIKRLAAEWVTLRDQRDAPARSRTVSVEDQNEAARIGSRMQQLQAEVFAAIEAFLATLGRIGLILFPHGEKENRIRAARADALRSALRINETHAIADRTLRNKWMHYDEVLDDEYQTAGKQTPQPQRFTVSGEFDKHPAVLRLLALDTLALRYGPFGTFDLPHLFAAVEDIEKRTRGAIETWGDRWKVSSEDGGAS